MEGLNIAFNIFDQSAVSTGCAGQKVILFMTDGNTDVSHSTHRYYAISPGFTRDYQDLALQGENRRFRVAVLI